MLVPETYIEPDITLDEALKALVELYKKYCKPNLESSKTLEKAKNFAHGQYALFARLVETKVETSANEQLSELTEAISRLTKRQIEDQKLTDRLDKVSTRQSQPIKTMHLNRAFIVCLENALTSDRTIARLKREAQEVRADLNALGHAVRSLTGKEIDIAPELQKVLNLG